MAVSFKLVARDTDSTSFLSKDGIYKSNNTYIYNYNIVNADKGYRMPGAKISVNIEKKIDDVWTFVETKTVTATSGGVLKIPLIISTGLAYYRAKIVSHLTLNDDTISSLVLENPSDPTQSNYRKIVCGLSHVNFPAAGETNSIRSQHQFGLVYNLAPKLDDITKRYFYEFICNMKLNTNTTYGTPGFTEIPPFKFCTATELTINGSNAVGEFISPWFTEFDHGVTSDEFYDGSRTTNTWTTNYDGSIQVTAVFDTGSKTQPTEQMLLIFPVGEVYIPRTDDYVRAIPKTLTISSTSSSVLQGGNVTLPATGTVVYEDDTVVSNVAITWSDTPDTSTVGVKTYTGTFTDTGVTVSVTYTLTVLDKVISLALNTPSATVKHNSTYTRETTAKATYASGIVLSVPITWDANVNTSTVAIKTYNASYSENGISVSAVFTLTVKKYLTGLNMTENSVSVDQYSAYSLPLIAIATYSDASTKEVPPTWLDIYQGTNVSTDLTYRYSYEEDGIVLTNSFKVYISKVLSTLTLNIRTDKVRQFATYIRNSNATLKYTDGTTKTVTVTWNDVNVNTSKLGATEYVCKYTENGNTIYDKFILNVVKFVDSINVTPSNININHKSKFTKPVYGTVRYSDNTTKEVLLDWDNVEVDVNKVGIYSLKYSYTEDEITRSNILIVNVIPVPLDLILDVKYDKVFRGEIYNRNSAATLRYSDDTTSRVTVSWSSSTVDTSVVGLYPYFARYTINGITVTGTLSLDVVLKDYITSLTINPAYKCIMSGESITRPNIGRVTYNSGINKAVNIEWQDAVVDNITVGERVYTGSYSEEGHTVFVTFIVEIVTDVFKPLEDPLTDPLNNGSIIDPNIQIKEREFSYELFEKITHGEYIEALLDFAKYDAYEPSYKQTKLVDKSLLDILGVYPEDYILTFLKKYPYFNRDEMLILINNTPIDLIDKDYIVHEVNGYIYIYSKKLQKITINSLKIIQATINDVMVKSNHTKADYTVYDDSYLRLVFTPDGVFEKDTLNSGIMITLKVKHVKVNAYQSLIDFTKIFSKEGISVSPANILTLGTEVYKVNKFSIANKTDNTVYIPFIDDIYDRTYYEKFFDEFKDYINMDISAVKEMDVHIKNMKLYLDFMNTYFKKYLKEVYKYDTGLYEKLLMEKKDKPFYTFSNKFDKADGRIEIVDNILDLYPLSKKHFMVSVYDYYNENEFELYIDNKFVHRKVTTIHYGGKKYIYISPQTITENIREYIVEKGLNTATGLFFMSEDDIWDKYYEIIQESIEIFVKRRRKDYKVLHTGFSYVNRNIVELPVVNNYANMSVYANGRRLYKDDYYLENIGDIRVAVIKRKFEEDIVPVSITYYSNPITFNLYEFNKSDLIESKLSAEGDDIFVDGIIVTPSLSYTPDANRMLIGLESSNTDYKISVISYSSVKDSLDISKDYRKELIDKNNLMPVIREHYADHRIEKGLTRFHNLTDLEEYIFYLKYMVCGEIENVDVMGVAEGIPNMTDEMLEIIKAKYTNLFKDKNEFNFDGGVEKDYPMDIQLGELLTDLDTRAIDYRATLLNIKKNIKGNYIKVTDDPNAIYNMNYLGEQIKK